MSESRNGRDDTDLEVSGRGERRRAWPLSRGEEEEADILGRTRAFQTAEDPAVTAALAATTEGQSLVVYVLVLVQRLYRLVARLVESVTAIQTTLSQQSRKKAEDEDESGDSTAQLSAAATDLVVIAGNTKQLVEGADRAEGSLDVIRKAVAAAKESLGRIEQAQAQAQEQKPAALAPAYVPSVTSRQFAIVLALAIGALVLTTATTFLDWRKPSSLAPQSALVNEFAALRDAYDTLEASNVALEAAVKKVTECGHRECLNWRLEGWGDDQKKVFYDCVWMVDPACPATSPSP